MTIIPIVIGTFGTVTKELLRGLEDLEVGGRVETIQITTLLRRARIQRTVLETCGDLLSPLLFIITMMPLYHILRKCTAGYKVSKSQEKINYIMYMDDIKLFAKNEKELETLIHAVRIYSQNIGMEFVIEKCIMLVMKSGKRHQTDGVELPN